MANARYRRRGNQNLWAYEIREEGKTVAYNSGFKTKKLAEAEAEPILQKLRTGSIITKKYFITRTLSRMARFKNHA